MTTATTSTPGGQLTAADFVFDGPLGSDGAQVTALGPEHFRITLGAAPNHPEWPNKLNFQIVRNALGKQLTLEVCFDGGPGMSFNEYPQAWSYNGSDWTQIAWEKGYRESPQTDVLRLPRLTQDSVHVGTQTPLSNEQLMAMVAQWEQSPHVTVHRLGRSLEGRDLLRLTVTDPDSPHRLPQRWAHHISLQHPGEFNAQWRIVGMIRWLLSDDPAAADARQRHVFHFVPTMSPDGPHHGWYRVNATGHDMNRTYLAGGSDSRVQPHEAYICQRDFEQLMASNCPITTTWSMHTWQGIVEPIVLLGPEFRQGKADFEQFKQIMQDYDTQQLIKPLKSRDQPTRPNLGSWGGGPFEQFQITCVLCEGGSHATMQQNLDAGKVLAQSVGTFYAGLREG